MGVAFFPILVLSSPSPVDKELNKELNIPQHLPGYDSPLLDRVL